MISFDQFERERTYFLGRDCLGEWVWERKKGTLEREREEECVLVCERGGERELTKEQKEQASWFWEKTEV